MPPVEGFLIKGADFPSDQPREGQRYAEHVNDDFVAAYAEIAARGGKIIAREVVLTPVYNGNYSASPHRQDTHLIVNFPDVNPNA